MKRSIHAMNKQKKRSLVQPHRPKLHPSKWLWFGLSLALIFSLTIPNFNSMSRAALGAPNDLAIYDNALAAGWENWSWDSTVNFAATSTTHSAPNAIAVTSDAAWSGFSIYNPTPIPTTGYTSIAFWVYGHGALLTLTLQSAEGVPPTGSHNFTPTAGTWTEITVPLSSLGSPAQIALINIQNQTNDSQAVYYLDDMRLVGNAAPTPTNTTGSGLTLAVDVDAQRKPISPYIYGMNEYGTDDDDATLIDELQLSVRRWGGNATSRYNWQNDVSNHASDWYFNNLKQSNANDLPTDSAINRFINTNRAQNADSFIVLPLSGYVSNANATACGFRVSVYGAQQDTAAGDGRPDCGNGVRTNGTLITGNNPLDTSIAIGPDFVADWVEYLVGRYGTAQNGGIRFYNYDNEPDLWFHTHRDVQPTGYTYNIIRDLTYEYGAAVKAVDPSAQLLGPTVHGWSYYWNSPYDGQREDWASPDDRNSHGGTPFIPWYLQQMRAYEQANGVRILDYLGIHYYPQASGVSLGSAGNAATQALRLRSTRALWDPTYVDESWIADAGPDDGIVRLIPRMKEWINANYPGTKFAIGEYNWGGHEHINGALAQADVLGIFGREGVDLATLWQPPRLNQPAAYAFRIYRNYDQADSKFGDTSVKATSSDQGMVSIYAAQRSSDSALTIVIINKTGTAQNATLSLNNFDINGPAQLYRYSSANLNAIVREADVNIANNALTASYPANSITLLVLPNDPAQPTATPTQTSTPTITPTPTSTGTVTATPTSQNAATATPTVTPTPTNTPIGSPQPSPQPTSSRTPIPTGDFDEHLHLPLTVR